MLDSVLLHIFDISQIYWCKAHRGCLEGIIKHLLVFLAPNIIFIGQPGKNIGLQMRGRPVSAYYCIDQSLSSKTYFIHREQFICKLNSQFYHQTLTVDSSSLYKTSCDHFKTLHEILRFTVCMFASFVFVLV